MKEFGIDFYEMENGTKPAEDFLKTLDAKMLAKVLRTIDLLEELYKTLYLIL